MLILGKGVSLLQEVVEKATNGLMEQGVLGLVCVILLVGIATLVSWLVSDLKRTTQEKNEMFEKRMDSIEITYDKNLTRLRKEQKESLNILRDEQKRNYELFQASVSSFEQVAKNVERQTEVLLGVRDQVNKMEWELGNLNQKVDKIQDQQEGK